MEYQNKHGKTVKVHPFGISVHPSTPWVAGSLDGIVYDHTEEIIIESLEVKCLLTCEKAPFTVACKYVSGLYLVLNN